jgi:hypothetical protein
MPTLLDGPRKGTVITYTSKRVLVPDASLRVWVPPSQFIPDGFWGFGHHVYLRSEEIDTAGDYYYERSIGESWDGLKAVFSPP